MVSDNNGVLITALAEVIRVVLILLGDVEIRLRTDGIVHPKGHYDGRNYALWLIDWEYNPSCQCVKCVEKKSRIAIWPGLEGIWRTEDGRLPLYACPADEWQEREEDAVTRGETWMWNQRTHRWGYVHG